VGPIVAALAFVCSVGNIPLAAVLWAGGISFSGVIAFVFADLIVVPIVLIYRKYYGGKMTAILVAIMFVAIVAAALIVDGIFSALDLVPTQRPSIESISEREIAWNYTTALNIVFSIVAAGLVVLTLRRGAKDPVCGMSVDRSTPHTSMYHGQTVYFCSAHCKKRFDADPEQYLGPREAPVLAHAAEHD
jgi:YHS domain-containing protein